MSSIAKCGYCGWVLKMDAILKHSCFGVFNDKYQILNMDETGKVFMTNIEKNSMETSASESQNGLTVNGNNASKAQEVDEELIGIVQQRPALYDHRIPTQERTKLKKKDLWQEVSNCLGGAYSPVEAEKRWQYLRDCYIKARRNFNKIQSSEKRSGAACTPINERNKPSFRYYDIMSFLNDTLKYKETVTSLKLSNKIETNNFSVPSPSCSNSSSNDSNDCANLENRPPLTPSPVSEFSTAISSSRKRRHSNNTDELDRALLEALNTNIQPSPIDGFMLRLAEGMSRLPYRERSNLELEFLIKLRETEERLGLLNN